METNNNFDGTNYTNEVTKILPLEALQAHSNNEIFLVFF